MGRVDLNKRVYDIGDSLTVGLLLDAHELENLTHVLCFSESFIFTFQSIRSCFVSILAKHLLSSSGEERILLIWW